MTATTLLAESSAKLMPQAQSTMQRLYGVSLAILTVCETRWSTLQMCMASLFLVRGALSCWVAELGQAAPQALLPLKSDGFWAQLQTAEWTIRPISEAPFDLEREDTTLADTFCVYGSIYQHLSGSSV